MYALEIDQITKVYGTGVSAINSLDNVSLKIKTGEFVALVGPSGSGKTTLLNIMSGLDAPTKGVARLAGKDISSISGDELSDFRRDYVGFIFQSYNLIPVLTVYENVDFVLSLQGVNKNERQNRVDETLSLLGLKDMGKRFPGELSGGQQQRVAVARAIVTKPQLVFADEPTANLDSHTGSRLIELMRDLNDSKGITFVFSTHDHQIMKAAKRIVSIKDGKIIEDAFKEA